MQLLGVLSSRYFGGFVSNPTYVARAIECSYECGPAKWQQPRGYMITVMARHVPTPTVTSTSAPYTPLRPPQHVSDDYYLFVIESPQWDESKITYIQPGTGAWESVPRCSVRRYKVTQAGVLTRAPHAGDAMSDAPTTCTVEQLERHYHVRHYRPYTAPVHLLNRHEMIDPQAVDTWHRVTPLTL